MEELFTAHMEVNERLVSYHVHFENDKYIFSSKGDNADVPEFGITRENNEWHEDRELNPAIKKQALSALDNYLLAQH